jgi:hypothetical protein
LTYIWRCCPIGFNKLQQLVRSNLKISDHILWQRLCRQYSMWLTYSHSNSRMVSWSSVEIEGLSSLAFIN